MNSLKQCIPASEEFAFLQSHKAEIELAINAGIGVDDAALNALVHLRGCRHSANVVVRS